MITPGSTDLPDRTRRLLVAACVCGLLLFAPLACIFHCHIWPWLNPDTAAAEFLCGPVPRLERQADPPSTPLAARLPRVVYEATFAAALATAALFRFALRDADPQRRLTGCADPPPSPPPRFGEHPVWIRGLLMSLSG